MNIAFADTVLVKALETRKSAYHGIVISVFDQAKLNLNHRLPAIFPKFTLHDIDHSIRVMEYIAKLLYDIDKLNELEIAILICSALLHDIGMAPSEEFLSEVRQDNCALTEIKYSALLTKYNNDDLTAIQQFLRMIHGDISELMVNESYSHLMNIPELPATSFAEDVALLCNGHTKDFTWIQHNLNQLKEKGRNNYNPIFLCILLRLGDILDIDSRRTPLYLYNLVNPQGIGITEWTKHFVISNTDKIKLDKQTNQKNIVFYGSCSDATIHRSLLRYFDLINQEIDFSLRTTQNFKDEHRIFIRDRIESHIETKGYTISNFKLTVDFLSITNLLMGEKIYGHRMFGLRELIQNSIDACKVRNESEIKQSSFGEDKYIPTIKIILDTATDTVIIKDNGSGMSESIIKNYFLNIGKSFYVSDDFLLKDYEYKPIGNFGIGFLSCFMLSDKVIVKTSTPDSSSRYDIELIKHSEYISFGIIDDVKFVGTEICLNYPQFMSVFDNSIEKLKSFINTYFLNENIEIHIIDKTNENEFIIKNKLNIDVTKGANQHIIDFSKYLNHCEGFGLLKQKNLFIHNIQDFPINGNNLYYDGNSLLKLDFQALSKIINNNKIDYIQLPLYETYTESEFQKALDLLDSYDDVIYKLEPDQYANIYLDSSLDMSISDGSTNFDNDYYFLDNLCIEDVFKYLEIDGFCPKVNIESFYLLPNNEFNLYLPFHEKIIHSNYWGENKYKVFIRDVYLDSYNFRSPSLPKILEIEKLKVNFLNKKIIPDISRKSLDDQTNLSVNYSLNKAILQFVLDNFNMIPSEKDLLNQYILTYYNDQSVLQK